MPRDTPPFDGIVLDIAPGANPAASADTFAWQYAGKRRTTSDLVIVAGRDDEASEVEAGSLNATFENRDGNLSPRNIIGNLFGQIRRGTPIRVRWERTSDDFARTTTGGWGTNADGFAWVTTNSNGTYATNGSQATAVLPTNNATRATLTDAGSKDVEVTWSTTLDVLPTGGSFVSAGLFRQTDVDNYLAAHVELQAAGTIAVKIQRINAGATNVLLGVTSTGLTYSAGQKVWAKARADGPYVMVKAWTGLLTDEPDAWQGTATDTVTDGIQTGIELWRVNTNVGTYTAKVDDFALTNILWSGNVPEWPPRWPDKSGADSVMPIVGAGIMRRLGQGNGTVRSPLRHQLGGLSYSHSYYPLEDGSGATAASSGLSRGRAATVVDGTFAGDDTLAGASTSLVLNTAGSSIVTGAIFSTDTADGYANLALFKLSTLPVADATLMEIRAVGTATRWQIYINATAIGFRGYDNTGTLIADAVNTFTGSIDPTDWFALQLETNVSGGTVSVAQIWHQVGSVVYYAQTDSYAGTATRCTGFTVYAATDSMSVGHLWFGDNDLPFVTNSFSLVSNGYEGELAGDRITRLCAENGVPVAVAEGDTEPMGRQRTAKLVDLLRECEAADQGILYERGLSLAYTPRVLRYNVPVAFVVPWQGFFDEPPEPTDDDQRLRNQWTVSRTDGGSATVADQESIDAHGLYDDQATLNIASDERLTDYAAWFTNLGTSDDLRWPRVKINLIKHPELIPAWLGCRVGSRFQVTDPPLAIAGEQIDLIIEGYTETINLFRWDVELSCSPARLWEVGVYDDADARYDAIATTTDELGYTDTWCAIEADDRAGFYSWTSCPYDVLISGQRNTVLGMSMPDSLAEADGTFEDGVGFGWTSSSCTFAASTVRAHRGAGSVLLTVTGSPSEAIFRANLFHAAAPGDSITSLSWVYVTSTRNVSHHIDWYNGATFLSRSGTTVSVTANTWTQISITATAPASTTRFEYGPSIGSSPAAGTQVWVDDVEAIGVTAANSRQLALLERGVDGFAKILLAGSAFRIANPARVGL